MLYNFNAWYKVQTSEQPEAVRPKLIPANNQIFSLDEEEAGGAHPLINLFRDCIINFYFLKPKKHLATDISVAV